jgi:hypothetical protein
VQKLIELLDIVIVDAPEQVGEPSLRIDIIELGGLDQGVHDRGPLVTAIGAGRRRGLTYTTTRTINFEPLY